MKDQISKIYNHFENFVNDSLKEKGDYENEDMFTVRTEKKDSKEQNS